MVSCCVHRGAGSCSTVLARPALIFALASSEQAVRHHGTFDRLDAQLPYEVAGGSGTCLMAQPRSRNTDVHEVFCHRCT